MGKSRWKIFIPRRSINKTEIESCLAGKIHRHCSSCRIVVVIASDVIRNLENVKDFTSNLTKRGYSGALCWGKKYAFFIHSELTVWKQRLKLTLDRTLGSVDLFVFQTNLKMSTSWLNFTLHFWWMFLNQTTSTMCTVHCTWHTFL